MSKEQEILELIIFNRNLQYLYDLESWSVGTLKQLLAVLQKAQREILDYLDAVGAGLTDWSEARSIALLDNFNDLTVAARTMLGESIVEIASIVGTNALSVHSDILSFGGRIENFNNVAMSPNQLKSFIQETPLGGRVLQDWVDRVYEYSVQEQIKKELLSGVIQGESYSSLVERIGEGFGIAESDAIMVARTYVQGANVAAQEMVYEGNRDIVKGVQWVATLETSYKKTGRGTCLACAGLDGTRWGWGEKRPQCPLHPLCRCCLVPWTKTWKELGIKDMEEVEEAYRPYTIRPNINIGSGRKGKTILQAGRIQGNYEDFFYQQSDRFQKNVVGPTRFELIQSGRIRFNELVDKSTGRLLTLKELQ
jgi:hypothetical protein